MTNCYSTDIVIFGGGIAGLWLLDKLQNHGYDTVLLEKNALGSGQTMAAQGIIHGGMKYALDGVLSSSSSAIADMPAHWRSCLRGEADVDLRGCEVLSKQYYMWSDSSYMSRLKTFLGSKALRGRIESLERPKYPAFFKSQGNGSLYQLTDFVVSTASLVSTLAERHKDRLFSIADTKVKFSVTSDKKIDSLDFIKNDSKLRLTAKSYLFCAGEGNATLLNEIGADKPAMQTRSLHMVAVKHNNAHCAFAHCLGKSFAPKPKLTITSHAAEDGEIIWYLGGDLAEQGINRNSDQQIVAAQKLLGKLFPSINLTDARWGSFLINRAEPAISNLQRPDSSYTYTSNNYMVCWPTKLTLCPHLGNEVLSKLISQKVSPSTINDSTVTLSLDQFLGKPEIAPPRWEELFK